MEPWKTMDSAPKTGEHILIYSKYANSAETYHVGYWYEKLKAWVDSSSILILPSAFLWMSIPPVNKETQVKKTISDIWKKIW